MDVSVIMVSYNTYAMTHEAIASCFSATPALQIEVIVVDNNSPDESASRLKKAFGDEHPLTIIKNEDNKGFAAANNQGAALAAGRFLFFLNPDTIVHDRAINRLVDFLSTHNEAGAAGPRVLNTDGTDQVSIARFATVWTILQHHLPISALFKRKPATRDLLPDATKVVDVIKGCAIMIGKDVFSKIGGWDESYFMYSEETELCLALTRAGYKNYFVNEAVITHHGGQSSMSYYAEQQVVQQQSALQYLRRHYSMPVRIVYRLSGLLGFGVRALVFPVLAAIRPARAANYKLRGKAASRLFRWFLGEAGRP